MSDGEAAENEALRNRSPRAGWSTRVPYVWRQNRGTAVAGVFGRLSEVSIDLI